MTPRERQNLLDLIDDLYYETQEFPGQTENCPAKIRELVVKLEEILRKILEK
jgi:hypothetical protein